MRWKELVVFIRKRCCEMFVGNGAMGKLCFFFNKTNDNESY